MFSSQRNSGCLCFSYQDDMEFWKVVEFPELNLKIFKLIKTFNEDGDQEIRHGVNRAVYVIHNTGDTTVVNDQVLSEIEKLHLRCFYCCDIIEQLKMFLLDINQIQKNEILVFCNFCKTYSKTNKCLYCASVIKQFVEFSANIAHTKHATVTIDIDERKGSKDGVVNIGEKAVSFKKMLEEQRKDETTQVQDKNILSSIYKNEKVCFYGDDSKHNLHDIISSIKPFSDTEFSHNNYLVTMKKKKQKSCTFPKSHSEVMLSNLSDVFKNQEIISDQEYFFPKQKVMKIESQISSTDLLCQIIRDKNIKKQHFEKKIRSLSATNIHEKNRFKHDVEDINWEKDIENLKYDEDKSSIESNPDENLIQRIKAGQFDRIRKEMISNKKYNLMSSDLNDKKYSKPPSKIDKFKLDTQKEISKTAAVTEKKPMFDLNAMEKSHRPSVKYTEDGEENKEKLMIKKRESKIGDKILPQQEDMQLTSKRETLKERKKSYFDSEELKNRANFGEKATDDAKPKPKINEITKEYPKPKQKLIDSGKDSAKSKQITKVPKKDSAKSEKKSNQITKEITQPKEKSHDTAKTERKPNETTKEITKSKEKSHDSAKSERIPIDTAKEIAKSKQKSHDIVKPERKPNDTTKEIAKSKEKSHDSAKTERKPNETTKEIPKSQTKSHLSDSTKSKLVTNDTTKDLPQSKQKSSETTKDYPKPKQKPIDTSKNIAKTEGKPEERKKEMAKSKEKTSEPPKDNNQVESKKDQKTSKKADTFIEETRKEHTQKADKVNEVIAEKNKSHPEIKEHEKGSNLSKDETQGEHFKDKKELQKKNKDQLPVRNIQNDNKTDVPEVKKNLEETKTTSKRDEAIAQKKENLGDEKREKNLTNKVIEKKISKEKVAKNEDKILTKDNATKKKDNPDIKEAPKKAETDVPSSKNASKDDPNTLLTDVRNLMKIAEDRAKSTPVNEFKLGPLKSEKTEKPTIIGPEPSIDRLLEERRLEEAPNLEVEDYVPDVLDEEQVLRFKISISKTMVSDLPIQYEEEEQCNVQKQPKLKMIVGNKISKLNPSYWAEVKDFPSQPKKEIEIKQNEAIGKPLEKTSSVKRTKGVLKYALSDPSFIEKGWTMLPVEKIVRKINVYRMRPAHPEFDWFQYKKGKGELRYDSGEPLAHINENGLGWWFYKNGRIALNYYDSQDSNAKQRFVVYSNGLPDERGRSWPITVLATFDYLGNGIVFDHSGKIRLKYNQTEGVILDRSLGPVSHWKWHSLNDPPVLQRVMIDTYAPLKDANILALGGVEDEQRPHDEEMITIENENTMKEKNKKQSAKYKPFQIKIKALKINDNFSLRVVDQAQVYLLFKDGKTNLKLNLGMVLDPTEIIDTDTADVGEVANPLDTFPGKTTSVMGLQNLISSVKQFDDNRIKREHIITRPVHCNSSDKMKGALSKPLRSQLNSEKCKQYTTSNTTVSESLSRKPGPNMYYRNDWF